MQLQYRYNKVVLRIVMLYLRNILPKVNQLKTEGSSVGYISGCFDVIHPGHLRIFEYAKKHVDIVVVGIDNDRTIKLNKGHKRPIHTIQLRTYQLEKLIDTDFIFVIEESYKFSSQNCIKIHKNILTSLNPKKLFTNKNADTSWSTKKTLCEKLNIEFLLCEEDRLSSTSAIVQKIGFEL